MSLYIWVVAGVWQDDTVRVLWQDQWDKGDEYALNMLAAHCPKCPARFVNNVHVRDSISRTLASPAALSSAGTGGRGSHPGMQSLCTEYRFC